MLVKNGFTNRTSLHIIVFFDTERRGGIVEKNGASRLDKRSSIVWRIQKKLADLTACIEKPHIMVKCTRHRVTETVR